jgi:hypothetical protein
VGVRLGIGEDFDDQGGVDRGGPRSIRRSRSARSGGQDGRLGGRPAGWLQERGDRGGLGVWQGLGAAGDEQSAGHVRVWDGKDEPVRVLEGAENGWEVTALDVSRVPPTSGPIRHWNDGSEGR